jgi:26S proteasome regulatory subunit N3
LPAHLMRADLKEIASVIEAGSLSKEVRRISRAVRLTIALRRRLAARDVAAFLAFALPPSSEAFARLSALVPKVLLLYCNFDIYGGDVFKH